MPSLLSKYTGQRKSLLSQYTQPQSQYDPDKNFYGDLQVGQDPSAIEQMQAGLDSFAGGVANAATLGMLGQDSPTSRFGRAANQQPIANIAGQFSGAALPFGGADVALSKVPGLVGQELLPRILRGAVAGTGIQTAQGVISGQGATPQELLTGAGIGAAADAILPPAFEAIAKIPLLLRNLGRNRQVPEIIANAVAPEVKAVEPEVVPEVAQKPVISEPQQVPEIIRQAVEPSTPPVEKVQAPQTISEGVGQGKSSDGWVMRPVEYRGGVASVFETPMGLIERVKSKSKAAGLGGDRWRATFENTEYLAKTPDEASQWLKQQRAGKISPEPTATPDAAVRPAQPTNPVVTAKETEYDAFLKRHEQARADAKIQAEAEMARKAEQDAIAKANEEARQARLDASAKVRNPKVPRIIADAVTPKKAAKVETPASGAVEIRDELSTTKIDHKQFKSEINDRLDKMIAEAPSLEELSGYKSVDKVGRTGGSDYSTNLDNARDLTEFGINRVEIEIPGDGTFRIWNTREHLERLKALANRPKLPGEDEALRKFAPYNQGLSDKLARNAAKNAKREPKPIDANSIELGALGTPSALSEFITGTSPLNKAWEGVVDKGKAKIGEFIPEKLKQKLSYDSGRPEAWEAAKLAKDQNIASGIEETLGLAKAGKEQFTPDTHGKAYDYLDPTERMTVKPTDLTPEQSASLDRMRETQTKLTNEQVDLGLLDKDVAEANASTYLRRFYDKHEKFDAFLASTFRKFRIKGTGKRYLETPEQRMEAGIKRDPFYAFAKSTAAQRHDIEVGKMFAKVAESPEFSEFVGDKPRAGFATKPIPNTWRYGKLRNKYVTQSIYDDIMEIARPWETSEMSQIYGKLLGVWKAGKTAWNPATHGRNIFSSAIQNDVIAGLSPSRVDKYVNAIQGMIKGEPELKQFRELGGYEGTFNAAELQDFLGAVKAKRGSMMNRSLDYVLEHKMTSPLRAMSKAYQTEEIAFRYAAYKHRLSLGDAPAMAMKIAKQAIPDYAQVPDLIRKARRSPIGAPFISYAYKMLPAITESAIKHPLRAGKYIALTYAMNEFAKSQMGITDEQYNQLRKSKNFNGGSQILLPFTDKAGDPVVMDLTYNLPWGDMLEWGAAAGGTFGQSEGGTGLLDKGLSMLNPIAKSAIEIGGNRNTYTGRDLTTKSMSNVDKGKAIGGQLLNTFAPTFPSRGIPNIIKAAVGEKDYYGKERDLPTTLAKNLVGISVSPINQQAEMQGRTMEFKKTLEDYQRRIYNAARKNDKTEVDRLVKEYSDYARQFSN